MRASSRFAGALAVAAAALLLDNPCSGQRSLGFDLVAFRVMFKYTPKVDPSWLCLSCENSEEINGRSNLGCRHLRGGGCYEAKAGSKGEWMCDAGQMPCAAESRNPTNTACKDYKQLQGVGPCVNMGIRFAYQSYDLACPGMVDCGWEGEFDLGQHEVVLAKPHQKKEALWWVVYSADMQTRGLVKPEFLEASSRISSDVIEEAQKKAERGAAKPQESTRAAHARADKIVVADKQRIANMLRQGTAVPTAAAGTPWLSMIVIAAAVTGALFVAYRYSRQRHVRRHSA